MNDKRILYLFTRTPLHVGAGSSVGAIDQPIIRERHTGFPVIPATSLKGTFADEWNTKNGEGRIVRSQEGEWLFGATDANNAFAGALQFSEARLLAFPIRSARGSFAWITCPLLLHRAGRDGGFVGEDDALKQAREKLQTLAEPKDDEAMFPTGKLDLDVTKNGQQVKQIVLEEYTFTRAGNDEAAKVGAALTKFLSDDPVSQEVASRLVILSNGMMSFFAQNACEVAQHVRINDETGTAAGGALFNQENVPSETFFYSVVHAFDERTANKAEEQRQKAGAALAKFGEKVKDIKVFQFGGDASTGLGYCTVKLNDEKGA
jgi:CRISPR-associated protein Cmr4